jgi:DNA-binding winged helix-turn-helix (wHTH) protein
MVFEFDDFVLNEQLFELRRSTRQVPVQPKVLHLLLILVKNRDRVVTTAELHDMLWPGQMVGATSLPRAVRGIRRALGDGELADRAVRTVRGRGYRFAVAAIAHDVDVTSERRSSVANGSMSDLSNNCRAILALAAVIGCEFSLSLLSKIAETSPGRVRTLLEEATTRGYVRPSPHLADRYMFSSDAAHLEVRGRLPVWELAMLERQIETTSDERPAPEPSARWVLPTLETGEANGQTTVMK